MALMKSISGIRGTIGGMPNQGLTPVDIVKYTAAYATIIKQNHHNVITKVVVGRDGRISGPLVENLVLSTLQAMGIHVINLGLSTTPTVEMAVVWEQAQGGIILTASHNPKEWNALKLLNEKGEFISAEVGERLLSIADAGDFTFSTVQELGTVDTTKSYMQQHINAIVKLDIVSKASIAAHNYTVVVDAINSTGVSFVPALLQALGVHHVVVINDAVTGQFAHNPEPVPGHLTQLSAAVLEHKAHLGIAVDPDVDRLCFVDEQGNFFGEEYTLVAVADYVLSHKQGATVSNLSSTKALKEITEHKYKCAYHATAVGEVNVVNKMKAEHAVIGGEGNGGIIYPELHYGRDALVGIALFLSLLAEHNSTVSALRATYPSYVISKNKIDLTPSIDVSNLLNELLIKYSHNETSTIDGLKITIGNDWVHLRPSNTEPIIRIYSESDTQAKADALAKIVIDDINKIIA